MVKNKEKNDFEQIVKNVWKKETHVDIATIISLPICSQKRPCRYV